MAIRFHTPGHIVVIGANRGQWWENYVGGLASWGNGAFPKMAGVVNWSEIETYSVDVIASGTWLWEDLI